MNIRPDARCAKEVKDMLRKNLLLLLAVAPLLLAGCAGQFRVRVPVHVSADAANGVRVESNLNQVARSVSDSFGPRLMMVNTFHGEENAPLSYEMGTDEGSVSYYVMVNGEPSRVV